MQQIEFELPEYKKGCHLITHIVEKMTEKMMPQTGMMNLFIKHTSAALSINENADPDVRTDLSKSLDMIAPENQPFYEHVLEGADDMPAHIKTTLIGCSINIPISNGRLNLGTWQGIYLCEFRNHGGKRKIVATIW